MNRAIILFLAATAVGCSAQPAPAPGPGGVSAAHGQAPDSVAGTLRLVGSAPVNVRLVIQDPTGSVTITGPLREELQRLAGVEVVLKGRREGTAFVPADYRIRSANGQPVVMGTVESVTGSYYQLRTADGQVVYLVGSSGQFSVGQKVWVQGLNALIVQTHGVIRP